MTSTATPPTDLLGPLTRGDIVVLDGAIGTVLRRDGVDMTAPVIAENDADDYWSTLALRTDPDAVRSLHAQYLEAGADVITTNTFSAQPAAFEAAGARDDTYALSRLGAELAAEARASSGRPARIAGSVGPIMGSSLVTVAHDDATMRREHEARIVGLIDGGVDLILAETMASQREALAVISYARSHDTPVAAAFRIRDDGRLPSGEALGAAGAAAADAGAFAILINHCSAAIVEAGLNELRSALDGRDVPFGARPNLQNDAEESPATDEDVAAFAAHVVSWTEMGAQLVGGCCGTGPEHIAGISLARADRMSAS